MSVIVTVGVIAGIGAAAGAGITWLYTTRWRGPRRERAIMNSHQGVLEARNRAAVQENKVWEKRAAEERRLRLAAEGRAEAAVRSAMHSRRHADRMETALKNMRRREAVRRHKKKVYNSGHMGCSTSRCEPSHRGSDGRPST